ncbi:MAG: acyl-CoA thioesterase [Treponema sp.]|jgi:acyl-CoA thioester hydrolase|nr:acyl-CoA thioesterase [Treponema sp.]
MFTTTIQPRFGDTDCLGHINNTAPALWFEQARTPFFKFFSPTLEINLETWPLIMAHTDYDFIAEMNLGEVEIRTAVSRIGVKSFTVYHEARQQGRLCVKGHAVAVYFDFKTKQTVPLPEGIKKLLTEHFAEEQGRGCGE